LLKVCEEEAPQPVDHLVPDPRGDESLRIGEDSAEQRDQHDRPGNHYDRSRAAAGEEWRQPVQKAGRASIEQQVIEDYLQWPRRCQLGQRVACHAEHRKEQAATNFKQVVDDDRLQCLRAWR